MNFVYNKIEIYKGYIKPNMYLSDKIHSAKILPKIIEVAFKASSETIHWNTYNNIKDFSTTGKITLTLDMVNKSINDFMVHQNEIMKEAFFNEHVEFNIIYENEIPTIVDYETYYESTYETTEYRKELYTMDNRLGYYLFMKRVIFDEFLSTNELTKEPFYSYIKTMLIYDDKFEHSEQLKYLLSLYNMISPHVSIPKYRTMVEFVLIEDDDNTMERDLIIESYNYKDMITVFCRYTHIDSYFNITISEFIELIQYKFDGIMCSMKSATISIIEENNGSISIISNKYVDNFKDLEYIWNINNMILKHKNADYHETTSTIAQKTLRYINGERNTSIKENSIKRTKCKKKVKK